MKIKKISILLIVLFSTNTAFSNQDQNFQEYAESIGADHGGSIVGSPMIRPDGGLYYLHGKVSIPTEGKAEFIATLSASEENQILADALNRMRPQTPKYFYAVIPKHLQEEYFGSARLNAGFDIIGRYTKNFTYETISGEKKTAPVFTAERIFMWNSKNNPFKIREKQKQAEQQKLAAEKKNLTSESTAPNSAKNDDFGD